MSFEVAGFRVRLTRLIRVNMPDFQLHGDLGLKILVFEGF